MHISSIANNAASFSGVETILNNKECSIIYFSGDVSTFQIAVYVLGNIFWARHKKISLKEGLAKYPVCISFIVTGKYIPLNTFLCIIFNILSISACLGKNFFIRLPVLTRPSNSWGSSKNDLPGHWYVSKLLLPEMENFPQNQ